MDHGYKTATPQWPNANADVWILTFSEISWPKSSHDLNSAQMIIKTESATISVEDASAKDDFAFRTLTFFE